MRRKPNKLKMNEESELFSFFVLLSVVVLFVLFCCVSKLDKFLIHVAIISKID